MIPPNGEQETGPSFIIDLTDLGGIYNCATEIALSHVIIEIGNFAKRKRNGNQ